MIGSHLQNHHHTIHLSNACPEFQDFNKNTENGDSLQKIPENGDICLRCYQYFKVIETASLTLFHLW